MQQQAQAVAGPERAGIGPPAHLGGPKLTQAPPRQVDSWCRFRAMYRYTRPAATRVAATLSSAATGRASGIAPAIRATACQPTSIRPSASTTCSCRKHPATVSAGCTPASGPSCTATQRTAPRRSSSRTHDTAAWQISHCPS
jgi:hypothetical protein